VSQVEVLVEDPSAAAALELLLPRILGRIPFVMHPHRGKSDLISKLPGRLRGYVAWLPADWRILVVVDSDHGDCRTLKRTMEDAAARAGLRTRSAGGGGTPWVVVNRIAVEELEAWFFGDWAAVRAAFPRVDANVPRRAPYRDPDRIRGGTWEALERVLQSAGYFQSGLPKIEAARAIASHMNPTVNTSRSFQHVRDALAEFASA
jgi:hypothetical protein